MSPMKKDKPWLDHPPLLENWVNTSCDEAFSGASCILFRQSISIGRPVFCLVTHMHNRYHEGEKANDMQNQDGNLNLG